MLYCIISYYIISNNVIYSNVIYHTIISYLIISYHILSYHMMISVLSPHCFPLNLHGCSTHGECMYLCSIALESLSSRAASRSNRCFRDLGRRDKRKDTVREKNGDGECRYLGREGERS